MPEWSTAVPDWEARIIERRSLVPFDPLFPEEAEAALSIFRDLRIVDAPGSPTMAEACEPWVFDIARALFGSYDARTGRRLIRNYFLFVAKKNSKSTLAAAIMVTALLRNWRKSAELYILAPTKEVADNSFFPARDMVRQDENLQTLLHVQDVSRTITHRNTGAILKVIAADADAVGGKKASALLVDELWLHGKRAGAESMLREAAGGLASRSEGFVIYLSTQSDTAPQGVFAQKLEEFRAIRDGRIHDPRSLPILYEFPRRMIESGEYRDPKNFYITNPNLGRSVDPEFIADELARAERAGRASLANAEAKFLNVQVGVVRHIDGWVGVEFWKQAEDPEIRSVDDLIARCEVIVIGVDGGGLDDLFGLTVLGREKGTKRWLAWSHAWCDRIVLQRRPSIATLLEQFAEDGDLTIVDDELIDLSEIVGIIAKVNEAGLLAAVAIDNEGPYGELVDELDKIGVNEASEQIIGVGQGWRLMRAIKTTERKLKNGSLVHAPSRLMDWAVGNVKIEPGTSGIRATKQNAGDAKVDPIFALWDAAEVMTRNPEARGSVYSADRGLLILGV